MIHEAEERGREREGLVEKVGVGFGEVGLRRRSHAIHGCGGGGGESQGEVGRRWRRHRMGWVGRGRDERKEEEKIW